MNIALEKTEEHVDGAKKRSYGDAFVRGNNGKGCWKRSLSPLLTLHSDVYICGLITKLDG